MPSPTPHGVDLAAALSRAAANYQQYWQNADAELYNLCRRRPSQRELPDVYAKVAIIGRVYQAGISRSSRAERDRESAVADGLITLAEVIESGLADLADRQFNEATAWAIIQLHGQVSVGLLRYTGDRWLQSFVSKYLHFHCDLVPIYDSRAQASIGQFIDKSETSRLRTVAAKQVPDAPGAYRNFVAAFVALDERIATETGQHASVKIIDHLLWRAAEERPNK